MNSMTCTRCGGTKFISLCKNCDPSIEEIKAIARAEAFREAYNSILPLNQMSEHSVNDDYLIGYDFGVRDCQIKIEAILAGKQEPPQKPDPFTSAIMSVLRTDYAFDTDGICDLLNAAERRMNVVKQEPPQ